MAYENLLVEKRDGVAIVTVNRPTKLNALNRRTLEELDDLFAGLGSDAEVRGVVVTGAGDKAFVAGADIAELAGLDERFRFKAAAGRHLVVVRAIDRHHNRATAGVVEE